jgi:hypothetical protein
LNDVISRKYIQYLIIKKGLFSLILCNQLVHVYDVELVLFEFESI